MGQFRVFWFDVVYSLFSVSLPIALIVFNFHIEDIESIPINSRILSDSYIVQGIFGVFLNVLQFFYQISKHKAILGFVEALNEFDLKVCHSRN